MNVRIPGLSWMTARQATGRRQRSGPSAPALFRRSHGTKVTVRQARRAGRLAKWPSGVVVRAGSAVQRSPENPPQPTSKPPGGQEVGNW